MTGTSVGVCHPFWCVLHFWHYPCQGFLSWRSMLNWRQVGQCERYFYNLLFSLAYEWTRIKAEVWKCKAPRASCCRIYDFPYLMQFLSFLLCLFLCSFTTNRPTSDSTSTPFILLNSRLSSSGHSKVFHTLGNKQGWDKNDFSLIYTFQNYLGYFSVKKQKSWSLEIYKLSLLSCQENHCCLNSAFKSCPHSS